MEKRENQVGVGCADIRPSAKKYIQDILSTERLSYGPYIKKVEKLFSGMHDCKFGLMMNSGTGTLRVAIQTLKEIHGWHDGDEVLVPAVTFVATANVVIQNNLKPVFVDVDSEYYEIDPEKIEEAITPRTRAIMPVHLLGCPCDMESIMKIAKKHNLKVVEDSCETMFANFKGKPVGSQGDIGCFSTYVAHLITSGVGGLAITNNEKYAEVMRSMMNHGRNNIYISIDDDKNISDSQLKEVISKRFQFVRPGYSFRVTEMEGALALAQLENKDEIIAKRRENAQYLINSLKKHEKYIQLPKQRPGSTHSFMMFGILIKKDVGVNKEDLVNFLEKYNVETRDLLPLTNQPVYIDMYGELENKFPVAKWINNNGFYIGCHQRLSKEDLDYVTGVFDLYFKNLEKK